MPKVVFAVAAAAFATAAAPLPQAPSYAIAMQVTESDGTTASPSLVVAAGEPTVIDVRRPDGYRIEMTVAPDADAPEARAVLAATIAFVRAGETHRGPAPRLTVELGQKATLRFADPASGSFAMEVTVRRAAP